MCQPDSFGDLHFQLSENHTGNGSLSHHPSGKARWGGTKIFLPVLSLTPSVMIAVKGGD